MYIVGDVGIEEELDLLGIQHCGGPADGDKVIELKPGYALPHDKDVRPSPEAASRAAAMPDSECYELAQAPQRPMCRSAQSLDSNAMLLTGHPADPRMVANRGTYKPLWCHHHTDP